MFPLIRIVALLRLAGNVAFAHDHGKREFIDAVFISKRLDIADRHFDRGARRNVGDRLGKEIRSLLIKERGGASFSSRFRKEPLSFLATFDLAANYAPADIHRQLIYSGTLRQWEE